MTFQPPVPQPVSIPGPSGVLQGIVEEPGNVPPAAIAVVCHPHPLQGGTMTNKVVHTLARACNEVGAPTVRFNYRGVGGSEGSYDDGVGETEDALAVIEWARARWPETPLWLAGFSFGGGVALRASVSTSTARLITVAPASARAGVTDNLPGCPWLLVQGDADDVVPAQMVLDWAKALRVSPDIRLLEGAGHFFHGRLIELREAVRDWLKAG
jgi:uncharacterized protein